MQFTFPYRIVLISIVLLVVAVISSNPWSSKETAKYVNLNNFSIKSVGRFEITKKNENSTSTLSFRRIESGEWTLRDSASGDTKETHTPLIESFLSQLSKKWKKVSSPPNPKSSEGQKILTDMGLSESQYKLTIYIDNDSQPVTINIGHILQDQELVYVSNEANDQVGIAPLPLLQASQQTSYFWWKKQIIELTSSQIKEIKVTSKKDRVELYKSNESRDWRLKVPIDDSADSDSIESSLARLNTINAIEFRPESDVFDTTFTLRLDFMTYEDQTVSYEWRLIQRPADDPAQDGEPPLFLLKDMAKNTQAIVTGDHLVDWVLHANDFRNKDFLKLKTENISQLKVKLKNQKPFEFEKVSGSTNWNIKVSGLEALIPAEEVKVDRLIKHASMIKIFAFPELDWDQSSSVGLKPPIAEYQFLDKESSVMGTMRLGALIADKNSMYTSHDDVEIIYSLRTVDGLSMPQNFYSFRENKIVPSNNASRDIVEIKWESNAGSIAYKRTSPDSEWNNLGQIENAILNEFCLQLKGFSFNDWRGFGNDQLSQFGIDQKSSKRMSIRFQDKSMLNIWFGKRSPRQGIYSAIEFPEGIYIFDFPGKLVDTISSIEALKVFFEL